MSGGCMGLCVLKGAQFPIVWKEEQLRSNTKHSLTNSLDVCLSVNVTILVSLYNPFLSAYFTAYHQRST